MSCLFCVEARAIIADADEEGTRDESTSSQDRF